MSFEEWYNLHKDDISEKVELRLSLKDLFASAHLAGAEPREKRIAELEVTNKKISDKCHELVDSLEKTQKENAQLKEANKTLWTMNNNMWVELEKKRAESQGITNRLHQLIKAKDLLNEFMRISKASDEDFEHDYSELIGETEQFLKDSEVEK